MKKIYYITNMFPGKHDNYGVFCKKTYDFFNSSEMFKITCFSAIRGKCYKRVLNIIRYFFLLLSIFHTIIFRTKKFDIIYIQYVWKHAFFVTKFLNRLRKFNKRIFINFHGEDLTKYDLLNEIEKQKFIKLCSTTIGIVVPSIYFQELLCNTINMDLRNKIIVTPSGGINSEVFFKSNICKTNTIIYCSRFDKDKGWDDFIEAANKLISLRKDIFFTMIGYGKETDVVKEMIEKNNLQNYIKLIINPNQQTIADYYSNSLLFVFPTHLNESLGLVALEAMSCGLPAICSSKGAINEYINNGINGFLYDAGNIQELTTKIIDFLKLSKQEKNQFSKNAIITAKEYSDLNVKEKFLNAVYSYL